MSNPQASVQVADLPGDCDSCQYCQNCDPKPGEPARILRFCRTHGLGMIPIEPGAHQNCPKTAPPKGSTNSVPQPSIPRVPQRGQAPPGSHGQAPSTSSPQYSSLQSARDEVLFEDIESKEKTKGQYGDNYETVPTIEGKRVYRKITSGGDSRVHYGNNYGRVVSPATEQPEIAPHLG